MSNNIFKYSIPVLYKDKDNERWHIRYNISYEGMQTENRRVYGYGLNRIVDLSEREMEFNNLMILVRKNLEMGEDYIK